MYRGRQTLIWKWLAIAVLLIAAALRFYGLTWGLPNSVHVYSYHPDEFLTVGSAFNVFTNLDLNPHFYNYPTLYIYLCSVAQAIFSAAGFINDFGMHLACRIIAVLMSLGAVAVCLYGSTRLYGKAAGVAAGLFMALAAVHVQHSHFATVDVPSTLFVAGCLVSALLAYKTGELKWVVISGLLGGFAGGTKYNAGLVTISAIVAPFCIVRYSILQKLKNAALVIVFAMAAFVVSTPGSVLYRGEFMHGLQYELRHSSVGHGLVFFGTGNSAIFALTNLNWALGTPLFLIAMAAIIYAISRKRVDSLILLAFLVPYFVLMMLSQVKFVRYGIPLLPCFAIFCAMICSQVSTIGEAAKKIIIAAAVVVFLLTGIYCVSVTALFGGIDTRNAALDYINNNVSRTDSIGVIDLPWFYSPPYGQLTGYGTTQTRREALADSKHNIRLLSDLSAEDNIPMWSVVSDYEIDDALRLRDNKNLPADAISERDTALKSYAIVQDNFIKTASYEKQVLFFKSSQLPHDMHYVAPRIDIYRQK